MQQKSFVLAAVLAAWMLLLLQTVAEFDKDILVQIEPVAEMELHSADKFVGHSMCRSKSLLLLPAAVGGLVYGRHVPHAVARQMLKLVSVAHSEV